MLDLLIYLREEQYKDEIFRTFNSRAYFCHVVTNENEVYRICRKELVDLLLVWPANFDDVSKLIDHLKNSELNYVPIIPVITKDQDILPFFQLAVTDVIHIPLSKIEFFSILENVVKRLRTQAGVVQGNLLQGFFTELPLTDILQRMEMSAKDGMMTIMEKGHVGQVFFRTGKPVKANFRNLTGLTALKKLCNLENAEFRIHFTPINSQDEFRLSSNEIIAEVEHFVLAFQKIRKELPDIFDDLYASTVKFKKNELSDLQRQVLDLCQKGESIYDLLLILNHDNLEVLLNIKGLWDAGNLCIPDSNNNQAGKKSSTRSFSRLFDSFFKKEQSDSLPEEAEVLNNQEKEENLIEIIRPNRAIDHQSYQKIEKFLETHST